jgi:hypothetical protein
VAQSQGKTLLYATDRQPSIAPPKQAVCLTSEPAHGLPTQPKGPPECLKAIASSYGGIASRPLETQTGGEVQMNTKKNATIAICLTAIQGTKH